MTIAIVGATGPTGFHLAAALRKRGADVRVIARGMERLAQSFPDEGSRNARPTCSMPMPRCARSKAASWSMTVSVCPATRCICIR